MNKYVKKEIVFAGNKLVLETGELAERANMAVKASYGDTVLLVTVTSGEASPDIDFFPLTVNYEEKLYASGLIKTSRFVKRDGRANDDAVITKRLVDHAIRPLFPKDYMDEVQVVMTVMSLDDNTDPEVLGLIATSAALQASDVPWYGKMSSVRIGIKEGAFVLNPPSDFEKKCEDLDLIVSFVGDEKKLLGLEAEANRLPESKILEALSFARENVDPLLKLIAEFVSEVNPEGKKYKYVSKSLSQELLDAVEKIAGERLKDIIKPDPEFEKDTKELQKKLKEDVLLGLEGKFKKSDMLRALEQLEKKLMQKMVLEDGIRIDGRKYDDLRSISSKVSILPRTHGSGLFTRGETQILTVATLGSPSLELFIQNMYGERTKRYIHYYNFPPYATGEVGSMGSPKSREIGHGMLAEKALRPVIPDQKEFPYMIMLVSETLSSSGSSSMASACASTLALMDAGVPIKEMVAGIALGLVASDDLSKYKVLTDLCGLEDAFGYMDFKIAGTKDGVTAIQVDMKVNGLPFDMMPQIFEQSKEARIKILEIMKGTISESRNTVSQYAPKMMTINIPVDKIGLLIGAGGRTIKDLQEQTETEIFVEESGMVVISSTDMEKAKKAFEIVNNITKDVKVGEIYEGTVKDILDFGALVEVLPGKVGLLHVSEIADRYVEKVTDWVKIGDNVKVKVVGLGDNGKISLSMKALDSSNPTRADKDARPRNDRKFR